MYRFLSEFTGLPEEQVEMECGKLGLIDLRFSLG